MTIRHLLPADVVHDLLILRDGLATDEQPAGIHHEARGGYWARCSMCWACRPVGEFRAVGGCPRCGEGAG